jgi:hypothetical protein
MDSFNPRQLARPDPSLLKYYVLTSLLTGPGFLVVFWPLLFKYETLRYKFEDDGMSMSWGAEEFRNLILNRLRASRSSGLGDEVSTGHHWGVRHIAVLREIRDALLDSARKNTAPF